MTLPSSGTITFSEIDVEIGNAANALISLNDDRVRYTVNVASVRIPESIIATSDLYGKSWRFSILTSGLAGGSLDILSTCLTNGWDGQRPVDFTLGSNTYSSSVGSPALVVSGTFPNGFTLTILPNVYVNGAGGTGGAGGNGAAGAAGGVGGTGISFDAYVGPQANITNNGVIAGGGGGGGGGGFDSYSDKHGTTNYYGGGGGGGAPYGLGGYSLAFSGNTATFLLPGDGKRGTRLSEFGGNGAAWGNTGTSGTTAGPYPGGAGGAGGAATTGTISANVLWLNMGTVYGTIN